MKRQQSGAEALITQPPAQCLNAHELTSPGLWLTTPTFPWLRTRHPAAVCAPLNGGRTVKPINASTGLPLTSSPTRRGLLD